MKTYIVSVPEVHFQTVRITAESPKNAIELVANGNGEYLNNGLEYSHTLEPYAQPWSVNEEIV